VVVTNKGKALIAAAGGGLCGEQAASFALNAVLQRSAASNVKPVENFFRHPRNNQYSGNATASYFFNGMTVALTGGQSTKPDCKSNFGFNNLNWETNQKSASLNIGYTADNIPSTAGHIGGDRSIHSTFTTDVNNTPASVANFIPTVIEIFHENRLDKREQWSVTNRPVRYVPLTDASMHLDYRLYNDVSPG